MFLLTFRFKEMLCSRVPTLPKFYILFFDILSYLSLQELHVCHNINRLTHVLPEQYRPVLNTCLNNILSHNLLTTNSSNTVSLCVKHLKPNAALPYTTPEVVNNCGNRRVVGSAASVEEEEFSHTSSTVDNCEQLLATTTTREKQIESEVSIIIYLYRLYLIN